MVPVRVNSDFIQITHLNRRKFIEQTAFSAAYLALFPSLFSSCKKETLYSDSTFKGDVIIIGAGASGMYAAYLLAQQGINVRVLEASDSYGGRVKSLTDFADFHIELGAEVIHGERSLWYDMVLASGAKFITADSNDYFYFNGSLKTEEEAVSNTFFNAMRTMVDIAPSYSGSDISAASYGQLSGLNNNVSHLFNALLANENGTSAERLGMHGLRDADEKWTAGNKNFMLKDKSLLQVMEQRFSSIIDKISLNTEVISIDYSTNKILITDANDNTYETDKVILTVPISILKDGDISFNPALPADKTNAFQKIGFDVGMKIILKFDERIWQENTGSIYGQGLVPEFWATAAGGRSSTDSLLTAFVTGEKAEQLSLLGDSILPTVLSELDVILGDATSHFVSGHVQDWGNEPYIRGAYSYPKIGTGNARDIASLNLAGKVFFAGEAMHTAGHFATVHGAMETALRAVHEILMAS